MGIEIYWGSGSPFSWRVLLALEHKQLPYESRLLQFGKAEHKQIEYLALNPRGRVPTLKDGDVVVRESVAILAYLERRYPERPLFGQTPAETAHIWQAVLECVCYLDDPTEAFVLPLYRGQGADNAEAIRAALPKIHDELAHWEAALGRGPYLVGTAPTAADITLYPTVKSLVRGAGKPGADDFSPGLLPFERHFARLAAWMTRIEALPGYERTYPPHWRA